MNSIDSQLTLKDSDAVIVTAGNGFAKAEGFDMLGSKSFINDFPEISKKYHVDSIGDALDKKFDSMDEQWNFWSQLIKKYTLDYEPKESIKTLFSLLKDKNYFIATSVFTHYFEKVNFSKDKIFNIFGDWTKMQCSSGKNHGTFSNLDVVEDYIRGNGKVPLCSECGAAMELAMPLNSHFFPDEDANTRFRWFLTRNEDKKTIVLELGVDQTSPQLVEPMLNLVNQFDSWEYLTNTNNYEVNLKDKNKINYVEGSIEDFLLKLKD